MLMPILGIIVWIIVFFGIMRGLVLVWRKTFGKISQRVPGYIRAFIFSAFLILAFIVWIAGIALIENPKERIYTILGSTISGVMIAMLNVIWDRRKKRH